MNKQAYTLISQNIEADLDYFKANIHVSTTTGERYSVEKDCVIFADDFVILRVRDDLTLYLPIEYIVSFVIETISCENE